MSDRELLIARVVSSADDRSLDATAVPPAGFARGDAFALGVFRGDDILCTAAYCRAELRTFGRTILRAALLGPPAILDPVAEHNSELLERSYRTMLDFALTGSRAAHVIVVELGDRQQHHVDVLWRLALALDGRLTIHELEDRIRVELYAPGHGGELAGLLAARPYTAIRAAASRVAGAFRRRGRDKSGTLAILVCDLAAPVAPVVPRVPVQFSELPEAEVRRRPRRFGVGLAAVDALHDRRQFVGRVDGHIVFRLAFHRSAPVLDLLPPGLSSTLPQPIALLTEAHTQPEFRNRSIFAAGLQWSAEWARRGGIGTLLMLIRVDNGPSLRAAINGGFKRVGELELPP